MAIRVLLPQPILPAGYEYLREHGMHVSKPVLPPLR